MSTLSIRPMSHSIHHTHLHVRSVCSNKMSVNVSHRRTRNRAERSDLLYVLRLPRALNWSWSYTVELESDGVQY